MSKNQRINVTLDNDLYVTLKKIAISKGISMSEVIRRLIVKHGDEMK